MSPTSIETLPARIDVAIVGAGQAGLSLSRCLALSRIEHVVLDRGRIAESWRSQRWDSFRLVTPNWATRLAFREYEGNDPDGFMPGGEVIDLLVSYAHEMAAPVIEGREVRHVRRAGDDWSLDCGDHELRARTVVIATGTHRHPRIPSFGHRLDSVHSVHASAYRSAETLPPGPVLVIGSGQSGTQIAEELHGAGREVVLATSQVGRLPRRYRGRDAIDWQQRLGFLDRHYRELDHPNARFTPDPHLSGHAGGHTIDLRALEARGIRLAGRLEGIEGGIATFATDLGPHLEFADAFAARFAATVDEHVRDHRLDAPRARVEDYAPFDTAMPEGVSRLALSELACIVWATGFRYDFSWIDAPGVLDSSGYPRQNAERTAYPGLHFLGLNWVEHRRSGILYGAGTDAWALACVLARDLGVEVELAP